MSKRKEHGYAECLKYMNMIEKGNTVCYSENSHRRYHSRDLPFSSQLTPFAAIFSYDRDNGHLLALGSNQENRVMELTTFRYIKSGIPVIITGPAGTGKSWLGPSGLYAWL
jgi:DNA replication protein DnaC